MNDNRDFHDMYYCIKCNQLRVINELDTVFYTGFHRVGDTDYPLGICVLQEDNDHHQHTDER